MTHSCSLTLNVGDTQLAFLGFKSSKKWPWIPKQGTAIIAASPPTGEGWMECGGRKERQCFPGYSEQFLRCDKRNSDRPSSSAEVWKNAARNARPETACPRTNARLHLHNSKLFPTEHSIPFLLFFLDTFALHAKNTQCRGRDHNSYSARGKDRIYVSQDKVQ